MPLSVSFEAQVHSLFRNVLGWTNAHSQEFSGGAGTRDTKDVIVFMPEINPREMGGTMRLGARRTLVVPQGVGVPADGTPGATELEEKTEEGHHHLTLTECLYPKQQGRLRVASLSSQIAYPFVLAILERHRHRYEVNPDCIAEIQKAGLRLVGTDERRQRIEIVELRRKLLFFFRSRLVVGHVVAGSEHPFFYAVQFHPEFLSRPTHPSPPFLGLILASVGRLDANLPLDLTEFDVTVDVSLLSEMIHDGVPCTVPQPPLPPGRVSPVPDLEDFGSPTRSESP